MKIELSGIKLAAVGLDLGEELIEERVVLVDA